jgi:hypothetical protein
LLLMRWPKGSVCRRCRGRLCQCPNHHLSNNTTAENAWLLAPEVAKPSPTGSDAGRSAART